MDFEITTTKAYASKPLDRRPPGGFGNAPGAGAPAQVQVGLPAVGGHFQHTHSTASRAYPPHSSP